MGVKNFANKSFVTRLCSGIVLVALLILGLIWGGDLWGGKPLFFANLIISLVAVYELYKAIGIHKKGIAYVGYVALVCYYALIYMTQYGKEIFGRAIHADKYTMIMLVVFLIVLFAQYVFTYPKYKTEEISNALMCMIYAGVMLSYLYQVRMMDQGVYIVWLIFIASWGSDTCAYVAGVAFGKHKMAPVLSPKKSIEGAIGGVVGAALIGGIYAAIMAPKIQMNNVVVIFAVVCAVGALISMVGDLAASAIKRNHDIKDYGNVIPGHGGIMDRFDSVIYVAPVIWILLTAMKMLKLF